MPKRPWRHRLRDLGAAFRSSQVWNALVGNGLASPYSGAVTNRLTFDWARHPLSADREVYGSIGKMKARARDLVRNNAHAAQALRLYADNVVGPHGVTLQCRVMNNRKRLDQETNDAVEAGWRQWSRAAFCTQNGRFSWCDVQRYVMQLVPGEGEALIRIIEHGRPPFGLSLQLVDSDLLDEEFNRPTQDGRNEIRMSVELDAVERPVAYHFLREHPDDLLRRGSSNPADRLRVPAREIIHLFRTPRLDQTRGVTWFAPVMLNLRMLGAYQEAEVVAARIAASKIGVIYTDPQSYTSAGIASEDRSTPETVEVEPGSLWRPLPGERVEGWDPQHPTQQYRDFVKGQLQSVASGLGLSYQSLAGDLEGTSFASGRTGLLQERDHYRAHQGWLIEHLHQRVFERWLVWASVLGIVDRSKLDAIRAAVLWQPRGWSWVDPKKDVEASVMELTSGLTSRTRIMAQRGEDVEEVLAELAEEEALAAAKGVSIAPAPPAPAAKDERDDA